MSKKKKALALVMAGSVAVLLSGCSPYRTASRPGISVLKSSARHIGLGWSIVLFTFIIMVIMTPVLYSQMKSSIFQQERMTLLEPKVDYYKKRMKKVGNDSKRKQILSKRILNLYRANHVTLLGMGPIPLIIQIVVFGVLYSAIYYFPHLSRAYFLGLDLGRRNIVLSVCLALLSLLDGYLTNRSSSGQQKKNSRWALLIGPVIMLMVSLAFPVGVDLYVAVDMLFASAVSFYVDGRRKQFRKEIEKQGIKVPK